VKRARSVESRNGLSRRDGMLHRRSGFSTLSEGDHRLAAGLGRRPARAHAVTAAMIQPPSSRLASARWRHSRLPPRPRSLGADERRRRGPRRISSVSGSNGGAGARPAAPRAAARAGRRPPTPGPSPGGRGPSSRCRPAGPAGSTSRPPPRRTLPRRSPRPRPGGSPRGSANGCEGGGCVYAWARQRLRPAGGKGSSRGRPRACSLPLGPSRGRGSG
jgi:hypothetical protein